MTTFTWAFDAPSGVFKQHALSAELYKAAVADTVFMDHVKPVADFGKKMGENVTLKRVSAIAEPTSAALTEGVRIPEDQLTLTTKSVLVGEIGRSVPFTSFAEDLSALDLDGTVQGELKRQMKLVLDTMAAGGFKNSKIKYTVTGLATNNIATNGTFGATASENF